MFERFERIVRRSQEAISQELNNGVSLHPFDERNIHPDLVASSKRLFDDGHYSQATFEAYKQLDKNVSTLANVNETGYKLMMEAFAEDGSKIRLTELNNQSEIDEQKGFRFIFAGSVWAIRNPRGHEVNLPDTIDLALDHLSLASVLLRRLENRIGP